MAPTSSPTSLLDSLKVIEILKGLILDQVRAVHGRSYPTSHYTFSVLTSALDLGNPQTPYMIYDAHAIVYTTPGSSAEWKVLAHGDDRKSTQEAIESLYCKVQKQASDITLCLEVGGVWNEAMAKEMKETKDKEEAEEAKKADAAWVS